MKNLSVGARDILTRIPGRTFTSEEITIIINELYLREKPDTQGEGLMILMEEVDQWKNKVGLFGCVLDIEHFMSFLKEVKGVKGNLDIVVTAGYLAMQVYQLQKCVEGMIEDLELLDGQEY